jgi:hypothetical protein
MLHVRYVHLTKANLFIREKSSNSSEMMLHKDYDHRGSVEEKSLVVILSGLDTATN